jgi:CRP/FNR family cyclic AMP-dependent transcriptional regulator
MNKVEILQKCRLFDNLLPEELEMLGELCVLRKYKAGETVFEKDDVGDSLYLIVEGEVDVVIPDANKAGPGKALATLAAPEFFGEMSLIDKEYRSASTQVRQDASLLQLSNENLFSFSKAYREGFTWVVVNIARVLSTRLRDTNRRLAEKL